MINFKKIAFGIAFLFPTAGNAQFDMSGIISNTIDSVMMSETFLQHLENCTPYKEEKQADTLGMKSSYKYTITGREDNKCLVTTIAAAGNNINATTVCRFSDDDLEMYVTAVRNYLKKAKSGTLQMADLMADEDYLISFGMMMDEEICQNHRDEIDMSKDLRANLKTCTPHTDTLEQGSATITKQIIGTENGKCRYNVILLTSAAKQIEMLKQLNMSTDMLQHIEDIKVEYQCLFDDRQLSDYIKILQDQVIPAGDGANFDDMGSIDPRVETDFINQNCELSPVYNR